MNPQQQGIMALPESDQAPAPQLSLDESYDAVQQGLQKASPQASQMLSQAMQQFKPMLAQLDDKALDLVLQMVQYLKQSEAQYPQLLAQLIAQGVLQPGVFPEQYDPEFLATLLLVLMSEKTDRQRTSKQPEMTPPPGMARGGIAEAARTMMNHGRNGDTLLAHINPREVAILRAYGGMGTINPTTGLPEYGFFDDIGKSVSNAINDLGGSVSQAVNDLGTSVRDFASTPLGNIAVTVGLAMVLGPTVGPAMALGLGSAGSTLIGGGDLKDALINGAMAYFAAPGGAVSNYVGMAGVTNMALNAAITGGLVGTAGGLLRGKNLEDSVKSGLTQAAISGATTGLTQGFNTQGTYNTLGASVEGPATTGAQPEGVKTYSDVNALKVDTDQNLIRPGEVVKVGDSFYQSAPSATQPNYFEPIDPGARGPSVGAGVDPSVSGSIKAANAPQMATTSATGTNGATAGAAPTSWSATPTADNAIVPASATGAGAGAAGVPGVPEIRPVAAPVSISGPPTYGEAFKNIYGGVKQMLPGTEGTLGGGAEQFATGAEQLFSPSLSKESLMQTPEYQSAISKGSSMGSALKEAAEANAPGMFRSYAPGVTAALGAAYGLGAFDEKPPQKDEQQAAMDQRLADERARVAANPGAYVPQGMQRFGLSYDNRGQLTGSGAWNPYANISPSEVPSTQFVQYRPPSNYLGIASLATGGYPRRTGQISGPGTETSDDIPAMLSDGEFVMTAKAVRGAGKGSRLDGAKKMYALMHQLERNASRK